MIPVRLSVLDHGQLLLGVTFTELIETGRQRDGEPTPYNLLPAASGSPQRLIIAPAQEKEKVSRQHLRLESLATGRVRIGNRSQAPLAVDHAPLPPGGARPSPAFLDPCAAAHPPRHPRTLPRPTSKGSIK